MSIDKKVKEKKSKRHHMDTNYYIVTKKLSSSLYKQLEYINYIKCFILNNERNKKEKNLFSLYIHMITAFAFFNKIK